MTLQELFDNRKAELQAAKQKIDDELAVIEAQAQTFGAWLTKEATAEKDEIVAFFTEHGL